ncbi:hypothetical protein QT381_07555 [Galbitalea sp. SE-J8]|uniref:hypothetical protein n=1 Tax=Galbitalea sp. SE-J8 TaxID=3054952 RepID=UPI00259CCF4F|nr:hypothetical protein [Galbitalea sp. SE-J8]MDM4762861.1 hypothetical protein [Galbitalea sp. SE-J8]
MKSLQLAAVAAVASALVLGGIAAPASAATEQPIAGFINPATTAVAVPALGAATLPFSTNAFDPRYGGDLDLTIVANGATYARPYAADVDTAGNGTLDIIKSLSYAVFDYGSVPAGTYTLTLTSAGEQYYNDDYSVKTIVGAAQSAPVTVTVSKVTTTITGWKTKAKSAKYRKRIRVSSPTVHGLGPDAKIVIQYRKKGAKKWKADESSTTPSYAPLTYKLRTQPFNGVHVKGKIRPLKRGTYYFRILIKPSPYVTGAATKQIKLTWR